MQPQKTPTGSRLLYYFVIGFLLSSSGLVSCKEQDENYFEEETLTQAISLGMLEAYDALEVDHISEFILNKNPQRTDTACVHFTQKPDSLIIQFSYMDTCTLIFFKRPRIGKIKVAYTGAVGDSSRTIIFDNYYVAQRKIEGTVEIGNFSLTSKKLVQSICTFKDFKVTFPEGTVVTYNGTQTRLRTFAKSGNPNFNTYQITADLDSLKGVAAVNPFNTTANFGLDYSCENLNASSGIVDVIDLNGFKPNKREVNFGGTTSCDGIITIITWRRTYAVSLN